MAFEVVQQGELKLVRCSALKSRHAFSTRAGGLSEGAYGSLNLGLSSGDDRDRVQRNREIFFTGAGFSGPVHVAHQVHGPVVLRAPQEAGEQGDALITDRTATPIGVFVADCVPILLEDRRTGAVAAVHSGWRGTAARVVVEALAAMKRDFGTDPGDVVAAIGPSIKGCCYQVGAEVVEALSHLLDRAACVREADGHHYLDLQEANRQLLQVAGAGEVHVCNLCTHCDDDLFFSYRRDGAQSGRMLAAIERP